MLIPIIAQKTLALGGIAGDGIHIWDEELQAIDEILLDEGFIDILFDSSKRKAKRPTGRLRLSLNRLLRLGALKHIKGWSHRDLVREIERNLDYRGFTQLFGDKIPSASTLCRNLASADGQTVRGLNERLCEWAVDKGLISGKSYRQDSTVC